MPKYDNDSMRFGESLSYYGWRGDADTDAFFTTVSTCAEPSCVDGHGFLFAYSELKKAHHRWKREGSPTLADTEIQAQLDTFAAENRNLKLANERLTQRCDRLRDSIDRFESADTAHRKQIADLRAQNESLSHEILMHHRRGLWGRLLYAIRGH